jgi:adenylate cyclase
MVHLSNCCKLAAKTGFLQRLTASSERRIIACQEDETMPAPATPVAMERKLAAIISADVSAYSRLMGEDEAGTIRTLTAHRKITDSCIAQHHGRIVNTAGDSVLAEFASAVDAVQCAVEIQYALKARNAELPPERKMEFRIGINVGDVVVEGAELYGDGVNVAARLQALADVGGIFISGTVYDQIENKLALNYEYLGEQAVKNIAKPVRVWRVVMDEAAAALAAAQAALRQARHKPRKVGTALLPRPVLVFVLVSVLLLGGILTARYFLLPTPSTQHLAPSTQFEPVLPLPDKLSIDVLPFANPSSDPEQEYFGDALTYDLITDLSKLSGLVVIAYRSTLTYKGKAVKVQEVSTELGVRYVLEGSVRETGDRILITAQLVDAPTGGLVWADRYDRPRRDFYAVQEEVRRKILLQLGLKLTPEDEERLQRTYTPNLEAYNDAMRAMESVWRGTPADNAQARHLSEKAIALDPSYAVAYAIQGFTYAQAWVNQWTQDPQVLERAFALAQQALALDDFSPLAHELLGAVYLLRDKQYEQAIAEQKRAIAHGPSWFSAHTWLGATLNFAGRPEETIPLVEQGLRLSPRSVVDYLPILAQAYALTRRYEEAIATYKKVLAVAPHYPLAHMGLTVVYSELGQKEEARAEAAEVLRLNPNFSLEALKQRLLYKDPAVTERILAALRKAGLK